MFGIFLVIISKISLKILQKKLCLSKKEVFWRLPVQKTAKVPTADGYGHFGQDSIQSNIVPGYEVQCMFLY